MIYKTNISCCNDLIEDYQVKDLFTLEFSILVWILIPAISAMAMKTR